MSLKDKIDALATAIGADVKATAASLTSAIALKAPLASPTFTGNPAAPTPTAGDNDTSIATTAFVQTAASAKVADAINDGTTNVAPSQNVVFDALAGKAALSGSAVGLWMGTSLPGSGTAGVLYVVTA